MQTDAGIQYTEQATNVGTRQSCATISEQLMGEKLRTNNLMQIWYIT
jgi:hypothetical protein